MALGAMVALMMMTSCGTTQTVPLTGRTHRISVSDEQVLSLSNQEYTKYMATAKKSTNAQHTAMVQRVGRKLATAVETYLKQNGFANDVKTMHGNSISCRTRVPTPSVCLVENCGV